MTYQFGTVRVDIGSRQVHRENATVHLTRKAFDLLVLLLERHPDVVSKEEMYARLWPETFVSESSIQALVSEIRDAIGDDGESQTWIRTTRGFGYAFCGDVAEHERRRRGPGAVRAWLIAESWRLPLHAGENIVGRDGDDVLIDATGISRRHARIIVGESSSIEDLNSKNGTWVRDVRVSTPTMVADGDSVRFAQLLFTFRYSRAAESTDTQSKT